MKKFTAVVILLIGLLCIGAADYKPKLKGKYVPSQAVLQEARLYCKEKYGFRGEIVSAKKIMENSSTVPFAKYSTGKSEIVIKHKGEEFTVYYDEYQSYFEDDRQTSQINADIQANIDGLVPGSVKCFFSERSRYDKDAFYDVDAETFLRDKAGFTVVICVIGEDLSDESRFENLRSIADGGKTRIRLLSFRSQKDCTAALSNGLSYSSDPLLYAMQIAEYRDFSELDGRPSCYRKYEFGSFGDLVYLLPEDGDVSVEKSDMRYADGVEFGYKTPQLQAKIVTDSCSIKLDSEERIAVFYPCSKIPEPESDSREILRSYGNIVPYKVGGYTAVILDFSERSEYIFGLFYADSLEANSTVISYSHIE